MIKKFLGIKKKGEKKVSIIVRIWSIEILNFL